MLVVLMKLWLLYWNILFWCCCCWCWHTWTWWCYYASTFLRLYSFIDCCLSYKEGYEKASTLDYPANMLHRMHSLVIMLIIKLDVLLVGSCVCMSSKIFSGNLTISIKILVNSVFKKFKAFVINEWIWILQIQILSMGFYVFNILYLSLERTFYWTLRLENSHWSCLPQVSNLMCPFCLHFAGGLSLFTSRNH